MLNRRLTYFAAIAVLADALLLGAVWHVGPTVSLAASLAVPGIEPLLAPLYADPLEEHGAAPGLDVYRPPHARAAVILVADPGRSATDIAALARALARREITTIVPHARTTRDAALSYAQGLGLPIRVAQAATLLEATPSSPVARAARAFELLQLTNGLLSPR
jgi:hypothetical protein